jgi:hypothetical protein
MDQPRLILRSELVGLAVLLLFAGGMRLWLLAHTEVLARDSIDYIRCAVRLEDQPFAEVLRTTDQAPGYPMLILGMSRIVRLFDHGPACDTMALSAQLVSIVASLMTIIPIYLIGRQLFNRRTGFVAVVLFQAFPVCTLVTSDGLSEAAFLHFVAWGLFLGLRALAIQTCWRFFACGLVVGLAYLVRPEGLELVVAVGITSAIVGALARSYRTPTRAIVGLLCGVLPFAGGYSAMTGKLTRKPTSMRLVQPEAEMPLVGGPPVAAYWGDGVHISQTHALISAGMVLRESARSSHYYGILWALVGIWWFRARLRSQPGLCVLLLLAALHALILWRMAVVVGYVSERHTMIIALVSTFWAGAMMVDAIDRWRAPRWALPALCALMIFGGLPSTLKAMHGNRAGHRAAGKWLADHMGDGDQVVDPFAWAHYYSGSVFREGRDTSVANEQRAYFVVLEESGNEHWRLTGMAIANELAARGRPVYRSPQRGSPLIPQVVVYRIEPGK